MEPKTVKLIQATCPECRGPLSEVQIGNLREFRCLVGHKYSPRSVLEAHSDTEERALWAAVLVLEESAELVRAVESEFPAEVAQRLKLQGELKNSQAAEIRALLQKLEPFQVE